MNVKALKMKGEKRLQKKNFLLFLTYLTFNDLFANDLAFFFLLSLSKRERGRRQKVSKKKKKINGFFHQHGKC
jgi:hypothetical protein